VTRPPVRPGGPPTLPAEQLAPTATEAAIRGWSQGRRAAELDQPIAVLRRDDDWTRDAAVGHSLAALGDGALDVDGWLRPRVWELADQIAAYIADGSRP
jgi:hypothetical protein